MQAVFYYISLPFLYSVAFTPFWMLYIFSDFLYLLVYRIFGYRKKVVFENLQRSFPEKNRSELRRIERKFYRFFFDLILETIRTMTVSPKELKAHLSFEGLDIFEELKNRNQSAIIVMGHLGNWELGGARFALEPVHQLFVVYHPLNNKYFNRLLYHMRTRLGNGLYTMKEVLRGMARDRRKLTVTAFIADQSPSHFNSYRAVFLHQDTIFFTGPEKIAQKFNYPVIYIGMKRPTRGLYHIQATLLEDNPKDTAENEIIKKYIRQLEKDIREQPEIWLWTHRRWKRTRL